MWSGRSATASAVADTSYYDLLGVEPTVSSAELQKAYRRKALRLHPDKGGDPDEFSKMKAAYDVLLNPDKRAAYDRYGPVMVGVMNGEQPTTEGMVTVMATMIDSLSKRERSRYVAKAICVACFVLSSPLLIALRWDGTTGESWAFAFLPLWLMQAYAACVFAIPGSRATSVVDDLVQLFFVLSYAVVGVLSFLGLDMLLRIWIHIPSSIVYTVLVGVVSLSFIGSAGNVRGVLSVLTRPEEPEEELDAEMKAVRDRLRSMKVDGITCALVPAVTEALLVAKLEGSFGGSWAVVLCPFILLECCWLVRMGRGAKQAWAERATSQPEPTLPYFLVQRFGYGTARLAVWVLVATRASAIWHESWLLCLAPLMFHEVLLCHLQRQQQRTVSIGSRVRLRGLLQGELNGQQGQVVGVCSESGRFVVQLGSRQVSVKPLNVEKVEQIPPRGPRITMFVLPWLLFGALKLDHRLFSAFLVFLPVFVLVCCLTCCFSCSMALITGDMVKHTMQSAQEEAQGYRDGPAAEPGVPYERMAEP